MTVTAAEIAELRRLEQSAAGAPWGVGAADFWRREIRYSDGPVAWCGHGDDDVAKATAAFICAARNALPRLLDEVERLRDELRTTLSELADARELIHALEDECGASDTRIQELETQLEQAEDAAHYASIYEGCP